MSMNAMQEAFMKSGMITEEGVVDFNHQQEKEEKRKRAEDERKKREQEQEERRKRVEEERKRKEEIQKQKEIDQAWTEQQQLQESQKRHKKKGVFDRMYEDAIRQKFLIHLVWNFLPSDRVVFLDKWEGRFKKKSCCVCNVRVISRDEILQKMPAMAEAFFKSLPQIVDGKSIREVQMDNVKQVFNENVFMALASASSSVTFCPMCYRQFFDWVFSRALVADDKINRILGRLRKQFEGRL